MSDTSSDPFENVVASEKEAAPSRWFAILSFESFKLIVKLMMTSPFCNDRVIGNDSVFAIVKDSSRPVIYVIVDVHYPSRAHIEPGFAYTASAYAPGGEADRN